MNKLQAFANEQLKTEIPQFEVGECFSDAAVLLSDYEAIEKLDSFSGTFFDLVVYDNGITDFELGDFGFQLLVCESLKFIHFWLLLKF